MTLCKIQNKVIAWIAKVISREIRNNLESVSYKALIADKVTDHYANKEKLLPCLRIVKN